jgi:hypothetical protein
MIDSEGEYEYEYEGPRLGYTPFYDAEEGDMKRLLAKTFSPALAASVPGSLVAVTTSLSHVAYRKKYSTVATLTHQGQKWVGGANGVMARPGVRAAIIPLCEGWFSRFEREIQGGVGSRIDARSQERPLQTR